MSDKTFYLKDNLINSISEEFLTLFGKDRLEQTKVIDKWLRKKLNTLLCEHELTRSFSHIEMETLKLAEDMLIQDSCYLIGETILKEANTLITEVRSPEKNMVQYRINYLVVK